jgi:hypothetical protein
MAQRPRRRPERPRLTNPYAVEEEPNASRTAAAAAVLTGVAGLAVLGAGTASADEWDDQGYGSSSTSEGLFGDLSPAGGEDLFADPGLSSTGGALATSGAGDEASTPSGFETGGMFAEPEPDLSEPDLPEPDLPEPDLPELGLPDPVVPEVPDLELLGPADLAPTASVPAPVTGLEPVSSGLTDPASSEDLFGDLSPAEGEDLFADPALSSTGGALATSGAGDEASTPSGFETGGMFAEPEPDLPELPDLGLTASLPAPGAESAQSATADAAEGAAAGQLFPDLDLSVAPPEAAAADDLDFLAGPGAPGDGSIGLIDQSTGLGSAPDLTSYGFDQIGSALGLGLGGTARTGDGSILGLGDPTTGGLSGGELSFVPPHGADGTRASIVPPNSLLADSRPVDSGVVGTATSPAGPFDQAGIDALLDDPLFTGFGSTDAQVGAPSSATSSAAAGPDGSQADPAAFGALPEDLGRLLGRDGTGTTNLFAPGEEAVTGFGVPSTGGFRLGTGAPLSSPTDAADGVGADLFGFDDLSTSGLLDAVGGTGSGTVATSGAPAPENPWRITTFDEENWPPRLELEGRTLGYAVGGILPTIGLTGNQRRIANGTSLLQELAPSAMTVPRSFASDILLGGSPIEVFEGDLQNNVAKSFVSGGVITALDEVARTAQRNLPEIQRRNTDFWVNRGNRPNQYTVTGTPGTPQLASGLARPTIFAVAPTVTALNLGADALTDHLNIDPEPTDRNNNRYYGELLTDAVATGLGVFGPIAGENYVTGRAAALRAGTPVPKVGNIAAQTALAFGLPALQTFGAGILTEEPPDKNDPIYQNTRGAFRFIADNAARAGDAAFGEGDTADGNGANATRAVGNATATLATPVLDAVGGIVPNAFTNLRHQYDYLTTGERRLQTEPVVSEEAVASAEASRARTQGAWEAARGGDAQNRLDDLGKLGANGVYAIGRGGVGLAHSVVAPFVDPFQSEESRFFDEPTQAQRGQESFGRVREAWQEAGQAVNGLLGRFPAQQPGSSYPTCGGDVTNECIDPRSLRDDNHDGEADNRGVLIDSTIGAPAPGTSTYQDCYARGECGDQSVPGSPRYGQGPAGVGLVGPRIPANPTFEELRAVYSTPEFAQHVERSFAAQPAATPPAATPPAIVNPVQATVDRGVQAARNTAGWVGDRADDAADAAQRLPVVGGAVGWLRNNVPGLGGDGDPKR